MRIIAGSAKGLRFEAPEGKNTRPTSDRVKESLFGIIQFKLEGADVLDLFSGSGNLALESLSRGAASAIVNDYSATCCELIVKNSAALNLQDRLTVTCLNSQKALAHLSANKAKFDFIFLDPPYGCGQEDEAIKSILQYGLLKKGGKIILEQDRKGTLDQELNEHICDIRVYGQTRIVFFSDEPQ